MPSSTGRSLPENSRPARTSCALAVQLLQDQEAELEELRKLIDEGDADIAAGRIHRYADAGELTDDIVARGEARSKRKA